MSLLRDRAIEVRVESTLSDLRPAAARDWLVRATSCLSDVVLYWPELHASVGRGATSRPTAVIANARATSSAKRRGVARVGSVSDATVIRDSVSCGRRRSGV